MARIRTVKPEFNSHEDLSSLSCPAHLLAEALLCYADDEGYFNANPGLVRAGTCPLRKDFENIGVLLEELRGIGYVEFGDGRDGRRYGRVVHFKDHQKISHPTPSKIKVLQVYWESSGKILEDSHKPPDILRPEQGTGNREQGKEGGEESAPSGMKVPENLGEIAERIERLAKPLPLDFPPGLSELQYATGILEHCAIVDTFRLKDALGKAIVLLGRGKYALHAAAEEMERRICAAQARGDTINAFWFEDSRWKGESDGADRTSPTKQRVDANLAAIDKALARRGVAGVGNPGGADGAAIPAPGPDGNTRRLPDGLRSAGVEVLDQGSTGGSSRPADSS